MALPTTEIDALQNVITKQQDQDKEIDALRQQNEELVAENAQLKDDNKDFEIFRPLLQNPPIHFYKVVLKGSPIMKQMLAWCTQIYGKRFKLEADSAQERRYARQMLSNVVMACLRYAVTQNSRKRDVEQRYLTLPENF